MVGPTVEAKGCIHVVQDKWLHANEGAYRETNSARYISAQPQPQDRQVMTIDCM